MIIEQFALYAEYCYVWTQLTGWWLHLVIFCPVSMGRYEIQVCYTEHQGDLEQSPISHSIWQVLIPT